MTSELVEYIIDALKKGYSENSLRQTLLSQGWNMNEVNQAFAAARSYQAPRQAMQPSAPQTMQPQVGAVQSPAFSKKMNLRRVGIFSAAKMSALVAASIGLLIVIVTIVQSMALGSDISSMITPGNVTAIAGMAPDIFGLSGMLAGLGIFMAIALPIALAITGFVIGVFAAFVYNLAARLLGGYVVEFE